MEPLTIVGAGGIGCAIGYALRAAGVPLTFIDADPVKVSWGQANGVVIAGYPPLSAEFQLFQEWQPQSKATVLLCTKCYDNAAALARLPADARIFPIQNGFDPQLATYGVPSEGIASFVSECLPGQTRTRITRHGRLHIGPRLGGDAAAARGDPLLDVLSRQLHRQQFFRLTIVADILPYKYTKLMYNAAVSPLASAAGVDNGQLLALPRARQLFFALLRENYDILHAAGIALGKIGPFHPDTVARILRHAAVAGMLAWAFYPSLRGTYCSMSGDVHTGRTEIDFYNRHLIDLAGELPCRWNRRIYELLKRMESERIAPGLHLLEELAREGEVSAGAAVSGSE